MSPPRLSIYQLYRYTVIKTFLIGLANWAFFILKKFYFSTFWPNLDKCFAEGYEINVLQRTFWWKRGIIFSELLTLTKILFICILLKHHYIPHINNLLLIPDWFVRHMMTCLRRHYWLHEVFTCHHWLSYELNKQKFFFTI